MNSSMLGNRLGFGTTAARLAICAAAILGCSGLAHAQQNAGEVKVSSSWSIMRHEDGKSYQVQSDNGNVTAKIDGKDVPADRVRVENGVVTIVDEKGDPIFRQEMMGVEPGLAGQSRMFRLDRDARGFGQGRARAREHAQARADLPKVMVGVQLVEPDATIRGHFGLKEGDATMISAVHQGLSASAAGLEPYDIIVAINGQSPASPKVIREVLGERNPGDQVTLEVIHQGAKKTVTLTTEKYDAEKLESAKVDAITSARGWNGNQDLAGIEDNLNTIWGQPGMRPFVFSIPGRGGAMNGQVFVAPDGDAAAADAELMAKRAMERAEQMRRQFGDPNMNRAFEERMKRMEEMLERMMRQREGAPAAPPTPPATEPKNDQKES